MKKQIINQQQRSRVQKSCESEELADWRRGCCSSPAACTRRVKDTFLHLQQMPCTKSKLQSLKHRLIRQQPKQNFEKLLAVFFF